MASRGFYLSKFMTQREIANTFTDEPVSIGSVRIPKLGWLGKKLGFTRTLELQVHGLPAGKVEMIGAELFDMLGEDAIIDKNQSDQINLLLKNNIDPIVRVVALGCSRGSQKPSPELEKAVKFQFTNAQLLNAFQEVYRRLDLEPFFGIMVLAKSLKLSFFPDQEVPGQE